MALLKTKSRSILSDIGPPSKGSRDRKTDFSRSCREAPAFIKDAPPRLLTIAGVDSIERLRPGEHVPFLREDMEKWRYFLDP
jgi:hypothetical protein